MGFQIEILEASIRWKAAVFCGSLKEAFDFAVVDHAQTDDQAIQNELVRVRILKFVSYIS